MSELEVFGTRHVLRQANKGTGWWCKEHETPITPAWVRVGGTIYPACELCFLEEMEANQLDLQEAIECDDSDIIPENFVEDLSELSEGMIQLL